MTYNPENRNPNALDLLNEIAKYLKCTCANKNEYSCLACDTACQFVFAMDKEGLIK